MTSCSGRAAHDHVDYYVASGNRDTTPEREIEILAERVAEVGARAVKFKIGGRMSRTRTRWKAVGGAHPRARRYFGDGFAILADGNGSFSPQTGIRYGRMLEEEAPTSMRNPAVRFALGNQRGRGRARHPLAFGEQETSLRRFRWLVENDAAQVLQPDIQYNGGFIRTTRVARMAELAGVPLTMHISGDIQYAYVLLFASFTPNVLPYQEMKSGYPETRNFFITPLQLRDGRMRVPEGPGLGMTFDRDFFDRAEEIFLCEEPARSDRCRRKREETDRWHLVTGSKRFPYWRPLDSHCARFAQRTSKHISAWSAIRRSAGIWEAVCPTSRTKSTFQTGCATSTAGCCSPKPCSPGASSARRTRALSDGSIWVDLSGKLWQIWRII
jgi:hypothetical protein